VTTLYGIPNCDTVKKAQKWLTQNNITYTFHDYRKDGLDKQLINSFLVHFSWSELLNKRSTSYRALTQDQKDNIDEDSIFALFIEFPTLIKRPLLISDNQTLLGFKADLYKNLFSA
jgi:Spx/MgsR family transcriptional regulator